MEAMRSAWAGEDGRKRDDPEETLERRGHHWNGAHPTHSPGGKWRGGYHRAPVSRRRKQVLIS